jgi:hypothetical protein
MRHAHEMNAKSRAIVVLRIGRASAGKADDIDIDAFVKQLGDIAPKGRVTRVWMLADDQDALCCRQASPPLPSMMACSRAIAASR